MISSANSLKFRICVAEAKIPYYVQSVVSLANALLMKLTVSACYIPSLLFMSRDFLDSPLIACCMGATLKLLIFRELLNDILALTEH